MRRSLRHAKNNLINYTEAECLMREVTSNDAWVNEEMKEEIYKRFGDYHDAFLMKTMLWKRLTDYPHISHVAKSLAMIEYILEREKSEGVNLFTAEVFEKYELIARLKKYNYFRNNVEIGNIVRMSAENICEFIEAESKIVSKRRASQPEIVEAPAKEVRKTSLPDINAVLAQYDEIPVIDDGDLELMNPDEDYTEVNEASPSLAEQQEEVKLMDEVVTVEPDFVAVEPVVVVEPDAKIDVVEEPMPEVPLTKIQSMAIQFDEIQASHEEKMRNMPQGSINDDTMLLTGLRPVKPVYNAE